MSKNPWGLPKGLTSAERKAVKVVFEALKAQKRTLSPEAMNALKFGNVDQFLNFVEWETLGQFGELQNILADMARKAGVEVFSPMGGVDATLAFDLIDQRAVDWASNQSAKLVRQISEELRETIRQTVADSTAGNLTVDQLARRIQTNIPLTSRDARAVENFRQRNFENYLAEGMGEAKAREQADRKADRYSDKMIRRRAKTIARTETAYAAMEGRYMGWEAGIQEGLIDNQSKKEWISEPDACKICKPLDGMVVAWDKPFPSGFKMAPAHPNCRCAVVIMPPDTAESPYTEQAEANYEPSFRLTEDEAVELYMQEDFAEARLAEVEQILAAPTFIEGSSLPVETLESKALNSYQDANHRPMQAWLRTGRPADTLLTQELIAETELLEQITKRTIFRNPITVTRGQKDFPFLAESGGTPEELVGKVFESKGFTSTSALFDYTGTPVDTGYEELANQFRIRIPAGARGGALPPTGVFWSEAEILLPPNTSFTIVGVTQSEGKNFYDMILTEQR